MFARDNKSSWVKPCGPYSTVLVKLNDISSSRVGLYRSICVGWHGDIVVRCLSWLVVLSVIFSVPKREAFLL
jgi:hypothetical protein